MTTGQAVGKCKRKGWVCQRRLPDLPAELLLPPLSVLTCVNTNSSGIFWEKLPIAPVTADSRSYFLRMSPPLSRCAWTHFKFARLILLYPENKWRGVHPRHK